MLVEIWVPFKALVMGVGTLEMKGRPYLLDRWADSPIRKTSSYLPRTWKCLELAVTDGNALNRSHHICSRFQVRRNSRNHSYRGIIFPMEPLRNAASVNLGFTYFYLFDRKKREKGEISAKK